MDPHDGAVDHLDLPIVCLRHGIHQAVPDAGFPPAIEAIVSRRIGTVTLREVPPWSARSQHPEDAVHHPTIVLPLRPRPSPRQHWFDDRPFKVCQIVAHR
jgi:hypothetical protein